MKHTLGLLLLGFLASAAVSAGRYTLVRFLIRSLAFMNFLPLAGSLSMLTATNVIFPR